MNGQPPPEGLEDLDDKTALAFADPSDYAQNRRVRSLYDKREVAYQALSEKPGQATNKEWQGIRRHIAATAANYAMDCLELADRMDYELEVHGPSKERFEEFYPGGMETFALWGGEQYDSEEIGADYASCRLVVAACDRFLGAVGLGGEIDPGLEDDLL